jgi:hypothetical protein
MNIPCSDVCTAFRRVGLRRPLDAEGLDASGAI